MLVFLLYNKIYFIALKIYYANIMQILYIIMLLLGYFYNTYASPFRGLYCYALLSIYKHIFARIPYILKYT